MKTINLVNKDKSDIKYDISRFPDGQQDIVLNDLIKQDPKTDEYYPTGIFSDLVEDGVLIMSRFNSFRDLELIIATVNALRHLEVLLDYKIDIHLYIPYLLGARSDRMFVEGGTSYLVDVVAPILNSLNFKSIRVLDVHSDVASACIKNLITVDNRSLVTFVLDDLTEKNNGYYSQPVVVSPDGGSLKKIYKVTKKVGFAGEIITCSKYRDTDGNLSNTYVPYKEEYDEKDLIIIDDICDGGRTFINIIKEVKKNKPERKGKNYLVITHGIFSAGFEELKKYFDGIYCTNSVKDVNESGVIQMNVF